MGSMSWFCRFLLELRRRAVSLSLDYIVNPLVQHSLPEGLETPVEFCFPPDEFLVKLLEVTC